MTIQIRLATAADAPVLSSLVAACLAESYPTHPGTPVEALHRDVFPPRPAPAPQPRVAIAFDIDNNPCGYLAWDATYDLHWAIGGAHVSDLYVAPSARGIGVALALVAFGCAQVHLAGGRYMRGEAYDRASTREFYSRFAVLQPSGEVALGGQAFLHLASLAGQPPRKILASLPPVDWNHKI